MPLYRELTCQASISLRQLRRPVMAQVEPELFGAILAYRSS
jgi:hypothetical protein